MHKVNWTNYLFLALAQVMVATNIVVSKFLLADISVLLLLAARFGLAAIFMLIIYTIKRPKVEWKALSRGDWWILFGQAVCAGFLFNSLLLLGLRYTDANIAGVITSTLPAIIVLFSFFLLREKLSLGKIACLVLATVGLLVINASKLTGGSSGGDSMLGDLIILISLIPEALYYVLVKLRDIKLPIIASATLMIVINAALFLPFAIFHRAFGFHADLSSFQCSLIILLALAAGCFFLFWNKGSKGVSPTVCALFTTVMPIATLVLARFVLGEELNLIQAVGMIFIILSIAASTYKTS